MKSSKLFIKENQLWFSKKDLNIKSFEYEINFQNWKKSFIRKTFVVLNNNNKIDIDKTIQYLYLQSQKNELRLQYEYNSWVERQLQEKLEFFSRQLLTDIDYFSNNQKSNIDYLKSIWINNSSSLEIETVLHTRQDKTIKNICEWISHTTPAKEYTKRKIIRSNISKDNQNFILFFYWLISSLKKLENQKRKILRLLKNNFDNKDLQKTIFFVNNSISSVKLEIKKNLFKFEEIQKNCKSKKDLYTLFIQRKEKLIFA